MVDVWDWQTRVLHWINMILILTLMLLMLGKEGMELIGIERSLRAPVKRLHAYVGYLFVFTFTLRVIWGFAGNKYAKWADMMPFSKEKRQAVAQNVKWYLSGLKGTPARVYGHDPLASLFYIALFLVLISQVVTGLLLSGLDLKMFPGSLFTGGLSEGASKALEDALGEAHEFGLLFMLFFLAAHLGGLVMHEVKERTGLLSSMIHGAKYFTKEQ